MESEKGEHVAEACRLSVDREDASSDAGHISSVNRLSKDRPASYLDLVWLLQVSALVLRESARVYGQKMTTAHPETCP